VNNMNTSKIHTPPFFLPLQPLATCLSIMLACCLWLSTPEYAKAKDNTYEIYIHAGLIEESIEYFKSKDFWDQKGHHEAIDVPRIIVIASSRNWKEESKDVPVEVKKELFYRILLPMILFSNELILDDRQELEAINAKLTAGKKLSTEEQATLQTLAEEYRLPDEKDSLKQVTALLERVDAIPPSLALGQTAYESGYGTSRFAVEGNALFGQWTYSGKGMKPREHRASKGNYGVAAYKWPFDSVRSYMKNLNTHNAYRKLRDRRAQLRKQGKDVTGMVLTEALGSYSEKGMEYVNTLQSIIRVNDLAIADKTHLRDEPVTLVVGVKNKGEIKNAEARIEELRASGELNQIIKGMRLH